jgi:hypothetical protein
VSLLFAVGLSHCLSHEAAAAYIRRPASLVARVNLAADLPIHVARTFTATNPQHVTVWATPELLLAHATVVHPDR